MGSLVQLFHGLTRFSEGGMVSRQVVRCEVCGALTLVRIQVGWQEEFPIRFGCGRCGILITGMAKRPRTNPDRLGG
jgi:ribosomal protein L37AE/L43A